MNIAIVYGLCEGPLLSVPLRRVLTARGHTISQPLDAEVILAHSGGWLMLPEDISTSTRIVLLDPSFRDHRSAPSKGLNRLRFDFSQLTPKVVPAYLRERLWNIWYLFAYLPKWIEMRRQYNRTDIAPFLDTRSPTVVKSSDPSWFNASIITENYEIYELSGNHDTCWHKPRELADILGL